MKKVLSFIWNAITYTRIALLNTLFLILLVIVLVSIFSSGEKPIEKDSPLAITFSGTLVDKLSYSASQIDLLNANPADTEMLVRDVVEVINTAARDDRINGFSHASRLFSWWWLEQNRRNWTSHRKL